MPFDPDSTYVARPGVVTRRVGDQTLLVPASSDAGDSRNVYVLNPVAEYAWERLDGDHTLDQICRGVIDAFEVTEAEARSDVRQLIEELFGLGLLEDAV